MHERSLFRVLLVLASIAMPSASSFAAGVWSFEEGTGTEVLDASGDDNTGTLNGGVAWTTGKVGSALSFDGTGRVVFPHRESLDISTEITIAAWISPSVSGTQRIVTKAVQNATDGFELALSSATLPFVRFNQSSSGNTYRADGVTRYPTDGSWMHIAATYDGFEIRLYANGVLESTLWAPGLTIGTNTLPLTIGAQANGDGGFVGAIDEVHVLGVALSAADIALLALIPPDTDGDGVPDHEDAFPLDPTEWLDTDGDGVGNNADSDDDGDGMPDEWELQYGFDPLDPSDAHEDADGDGVTNLQEYLNGTVPVPPPGGVWRFDEETGLSAVDASGNGNTGTLGGGITRVESFDGTGALRFDGTGWVMVPHRNSLAISSEITIAAWISPSVSGTQRIVTKAVQNVADGFELALSSATLPFVRFNQSSSGNTYRADGVTRYPTDGSWMHVAATYDGVEIRLYANGVLETTVPAPGLVISTNTLPLTIGAQANGDGGFVGAIDGVHVLGVALSAADIAELALLPPDTDGDGVPDHEDAFPLDPTEWLDTDGDGIGNNADPDDDGDGMPDEWELQYGLDPLDPSDAHQDADGDGVTNLQEYLNGTVPVPPRGGTWRLDEGAGLDVLDSSGNGNDGSLSGGVSWTTGKVGTALSFNGANWVTVPHSATLEITDAITIAAWIRPTLSGTQRIVTKAVQHSVDGFELALSSATLPFVRFNQSSSGNTYRADGVTRYPTDGSWMHVAATYDGFEIRLYANGVLESTLWAPGLAIDTNTLPLTIGAQANGDGGFVGAIDEVHVLGVALSAADIAELALLPPDTDGDGVPDHEDAFPLDPTEWLDTDGDGIGNNADPDDDGDGMPDEWELQYGLDPLDPSDAHQDADGDGVTNLQEYLNGTVPVPPRGGVWRFNEGTGLSTVDASGNGNTGTLSGGVTWTQGVSGTALQFSGSGRVTVPHNPSLDISSGLTIAAWIQPKKNATQRIVTKAYDDSVDGFELGLSKSGHAAFIRFNHASADDAFEVMAQTPHPINGTWMHVAGTFDGSHIRFYVNGVLEGTLAAPGLQINKNAEPLVIGGHRGGLYGYEGAIDEVHVYEYALSASAIADLAHAPPDSDGDGWPDTEDAFPHDPTEWLDTDGDGIGNNADPDDDGDGMPDAWEVQFGLNPLDPADANQDPDGDGITNLQEYLDGTVPVPPAGATWRFDEGAGITVLDESGNGNTGVIGGGVYWTEGVTGTGLSFNGGGWVTVPDHSSLDIGGAITVAAWIRPFVQDSQKIVAKGLYDLVDGFELGLSNNEHTAYVRFNQASAGNSYKVNASTPYPTDGSWMHVAGTYDGQYVRIFVNGSLENAVYAPGLEINRNDVNLTIGAQADGQFQYLGAIDDVVIRAYAFDAASIAAMAASGPSNTEGRLSSWSSEPLMTFGSSVSVGEKPQSKLWKHADTWWMVMPDETATYLWRLDGTVWTRSQLLYTLNIVPQADVLVSPHDPDVVHVLLFAHEQTSLVSLEYVPGAPGTYQAWHDRPMPAYIGLPTFAETATLAIDSEGRMWVAYDDFGNIEVRFSDYPYADWSAAPVVLASNATFDDIAAITSIDSDTIGVMWSDQNAERFGFRTHTAGDGPMQWSSIEIAAQQSALPKMADDHINLATASDGTLYAAVKTSYDSSNLPAILLLVRRPNGDWDNAYFVDHSGTRPIVVLNEAEGTLAVIYAETESGGDIKYKETSLDRISFSERKTLIPGQVLTDVSSSKANYDDSLVVIASGRGSLLEASGVVSVRLDAE